MTGLSKQGFKLNFKSEEVEEYEEAFGDMYKGIRREIENFYSKGINDKQNT